ncbi:MAG: hypothetical protein Q7U89_05530 [Coriobacteriia bacterium]|nr:hypothetical protein [Coriobacteriia bacterium]
MERRPGQASLEFAPSGLTADQLAIQLMRTDSEVEVVRLLKEASYWDDPTAWTAYGGNENNFSTIGNQQASPEAALVEKIINSVDAMLMRECSRRGIQASGPDAPTSTKKALESFFGIRGGVLTELAQGQRRSLAENIALVATGSAQNPCYTIIDQGEGQTPSAMPDTLLSLAKSNKLRIPFVQGKFNMGSTGALQFCSQQHNLQLIISRRDQEIADQSDVTHREWSMTVLRRVEPAGAVRSSTYKYLAPGGQVLRFQAEDIPAMPGPFPASFSLPLRHGTVVKLYEYQTPKGLRSDIRRDLYDRLSVLLPEIALPVRLYERRTSYKGKTMERTLAGLSVRLDEDGDKSIEPGFPSSATIRVRGQEIRAKVYAFKPGAKDNYARREGILFVIQGQAHGAIERTFFARSSVGMSYLEQSLLVLADCSDLDGRNREDLFMNSRDRLRDTELKHEIEEELTRLLAEHPGLRQLRERRREDDLKDRIGDSKPLQDVLSDVIRHSPVLSKLLLEGRRLSNPFGLSDAANGKLYAGQRFPTYFTPEYEFTDERPKRCPYDRRFRLTFDTDAVNDYFDRDVEPGEARLSLPGGSEVRDFTLNLWNGRANLTIALPSDASAQVGETIRYKLQVGDCSRIMLLETEFVVLVEPTEEVHPGGNGERKRPPGDEGNGNKDKQKLDLPHVIDVRKSDWNHYEMDRESALRVRSTPEAGYDFYVNLDNIHLLTELKGHREVEPEVLESQYRYGMVLIALALLRNLDEDGDTDFCLKTHNQVEAVCDSISPFLLPMMMALGSLAAT